MTALHNHMDYRAVLQSERWQEVRRFVWARDTNRCVICGDAGSDCHHWSYEWGLFNPHLVSLLCRPCHQVWQGQNPDHLDNDHELKPKLIRVAEIARHLGRKA